MTTIAKQADSEERKDYALDKIKDASTHLLGIINDILDMSKIEMGKLELYPVEYDTPSLINDTVQLNLVRFGSKPVEFILDVDENLPSKFFGDELRLKQILNNLLSNAIKYTEKGYVKLTVKHWPEEGGDVTLNFSVEDTGQGLKIEDRQKFFSEYQRFNAEANRTAEGTGLGLSITKNLVEMMDGTIWAESEYGKGSVFLVTVRQRTVACEAIGPETALRLRNFSYVGNRQNEKLQITRDPMPYGRVLIVDDVETNLFVTEGLLVPYKLKIDTTDNGFAVIDKIADGKEYDVIFMDHMMPNLDGMETTRRIREMGYTGTVVALTANTLVGSEEMFLQNGFDAFISKPIDIRLLNDILNRFIRDRYPEEAKKYTPQTTVQSKVNRISLKIRKAFKTDAENTIAKMREAIEKDDIRLFTVTAHAMKSVLANIGEQEASSLALRMENAGLNNDKGYIDANADKFMKMLEHLLQSLMPAAAVEADEVADEDTELLKEQLHIIKSACEDYDDDTAHAALDILKQHRWSVKTTGALEQIRDALFIYSDFEGAADISVRLLDSHNLQ